MVWQSHIIHIRNATVAELKPNVPFWTDSKCYSGKSLSPGLLSLCFADHIVPFTEIKCSLHHFPTQSAGQPSRNYHGQAAHERAIILFHRSPWSVWFGSTGSVGSPKPHSCSWACPTKSWESQTWSEWYPWFLPAGGWRRLSCQRELHPGRTSETSRSLSSSERNLQLITLHKLPLVWASLFTGPGWGALGDFGRPTCLRVSQPWGSGEHECCLEEPHSLQERKASPARTFGSRVTPSWTQPVLSFTHLK